SYSQVKAFMKQHQPPRLALVGVAGIPSLVVPRELPRLSLSNAEFEERLERHTFKRLAANLTFMGDSFQSRLEIEGSLRNIKTGLRDFHAKGEMDIDLEREEIRSWYVEFGITF